MFDTVSSTGGTYFKPQDIPANVIFALEVTQFEVDRPSNYGPKDAIHFKAYQFADGKGEPKIEDFIAKQTVLVSSLRDKVGSTVLVKLTQGVGKNGNNPPWLWENVNPADYPEIVAYFEAREAQKDQAPGF